MLICYFTPAYYISFWFIFDHCILSLFLSISMQIYWQVGCHCSGQISSGHSQPGKLHSRLLRPTTQQARTRKSQSCLFFFLAKESFVFAPTLVKVLTLTILIHAINLLPTANFPAMTFLCSEKKKTNRLSLIIRSNIRYELGWFHCKFIMCLTKS